MARKMTAARFQRLMGTADTAEAAHVERMQEARFRGWQQGSAIAAAVTHGRMTPRELFMAFLANMTGVVRPL